ncbi:hypothetical protein QVA66_08710 [Staphylococcus chromogenes]|nr:hypothetical protein [Staphylococcus chromogenes]
MPHIHNGGELFFGMLVSLIVALSWPALSPRQAQLLLLPLAILTISIGIWRLTEVSLNLDGAEFGWSIPWHAVLLIVGGGLLSLCLPQHAWWQNLGAHSVSIYVLSSLAATLLSMTFSAESADFGWSMYAPITDGESSPYVLDPAEILQNFGPNFPSWTAFAVFLAVCVFAAYRSGWGPVEWLLRVACRRF